MAKRSNADAARPDPSAGGGERASSARGSEPSLVSEVEALLEEHGHPEPVACAVDAELTIQWTSAAWDRRASGVASLSGTEAFGRPFLEGIMPPLDRFYRAALRRTLAEGRRWRHEYLAPTPEHLLVYLLTAQPLVQHRGLLLIHAQIFQREHEHVVLAPDLDRYRDPRGTIRMCGSCRVVARNDLSDRWDFLPDLLAPGLRHPIAWTLCPSCGVHYERLADEADGPRSRG
ncbi:MAG: hypothetical protein AAF928_15925 [Myxococcota bacterium]